MRIARIVVEPETISELRNQWGKAVWLMTILKLSSVGCCGRKSRLLKISACDLKALLIAQASRISGVVALAGPPPVSTNGRPKLLNVQMAWSNVAMMLMGRIKGNVM